MFSLGLDESRLLLREPGYLSCSHEAATRFGNSNIQGPR